MGSNILVCGNGPSCAKIDFRRVPEDVKIMRTTSFYFEEKYYAGKRVDFYVEYAKRLTEQYFNIHTINEKNEYDVDMENLWWTVLFEKNQHFPTIKSCTEFIQKTPLIAEFRCFYEYYHGQYLPTGMQAIALAFCLGFKKIYLAGFDLFSDPNNMHVYPDVKRVMETVKNHQGSSVYETSGEIASGNMAEYLNKTHPMEMQIKFLQLLIKLFPGAQLLSVCETSAINEHVGAAPTLYERPWFSPQDKPKERTTDWYSLPDTMPGRKK